MKPVVNQKLKLYSVSGRVRVREYLPKKIVRGVAIEPYFYEYEVGVRTDKEERLQHFGIPIIHNMTREVEAISPQDAIEKYNSRIYDDIDVKELIDDEYWVRYKVMEIYTDDVVDIHSTKAYKVKREEGGGIRLVAMKWISVVNGPIDSRNLHYHFIPEQQDHKSDFNCELMYLYQSTGRRTL